MKEKLLIILTAFLYLIYFILYLFVVALFCLIFGWERYASVIAAFFAPALLFLSAKRKKKDIKEFFCLYPISPKDVFIIVACSAAATFLVHLTQYAIPSVYLEQTPKMDVSGGWFNILYIVIASPVVEELVFRNFIFLKLKETLNPILSIILSSVMFAVLHSGLVWMVMAFLIGVFYSALFLKYKSLLAPIAAHMTSNLIAVCFNILVLL